MAPEGVNPGKRILPCCAALLVCRPGWLYILAALAGLLLPIHGTKLLAQPSPCTHRTVIVSVIDREGRLVGGLTPASFRAKFRGKAAKVISARIESRPRRLVVLLDRSGSMARPEAKWRMARAAVGEIALSGPQERWLRFWPFADTATPAVAASATVSEVLDKIREFGNPQTPTQGPCGRTALYDAVGKAISALEPPEGGDVIYVVTDGLDTQSHRSLGLLTKQLVTSGIRLFTLLLPGTVFVSRLDETPAVEPLADPRTPPEALPRVLRTHYERETRQALLQIVRETGGNALSLNPRGEPDGTYWRSDLEREAVLRSVRALHRQMDEFYSLEIELPLPVDKSRLWHLEVVGSDGKRMAEVGLNYPRRLLPCREGGD